MEPFDYPDNDPGPQTLLTTQTPAAESRPAALADEPLPGLCRRDGYMGARFTSTRDALAPILKDIADRGLIFADDGASARSLVAEVAKPLGLPAPRADIVIDATPTPQAIDGALAKLEQHRAATAAPPSASPPACRSPSRASPTGPPGSTSAACCWCRSAHSPGSEARAADEPSRDALPYRRCVGIMLLDRRGLVFVGRRVGGPESAGRDHEWQMPQGGIDPGEAPYDAALRELYEETNVTSVTLLAEAPDWYSYDIPAEIAGKGWTRNYRGQTQKWFAFRFTGPGERDRRRAIPAAERTSPNSKPGDGSGWRPCRGWSCRSSAASTTRSSPPSAISHPDRALTPPRPSPHAAPGSARGRGATACGRRAPRNHGRSRRRTPPAR